jgi:molybdopterin molybdotransferase
MQTPMLTPGEALANILARIPAPARRESVPLALAHGRCLAAHAVSDVDLPPFEKSMMDGFAFSSASLGERGGRLKVVGESRAGVPFHGALPREGCVEIFTGAELPEGCDAVEMIERVRREGDHVLVDHAVKSGANVSHCGEILRTGATVFEPRRRLSAADLSVLASIGGDPVPVFARPRISILTTGDELVPARGRAAVRSREGNTFFLAAACAALGCEVVALRRRAGRARCCLELAFGRRWTTPTPARDHRRRVGRKYDLVGRPPSASASPILHKVAVKPGKPIWFGMRGATPVFGLPGNPVSTLLGFEVFVRAALVRLAGDDPALERERILRGRWKGGPERGAERQNNLPARLQQAEDGVSELFPLPFRGSADNVAAARADALAIVPKGGELRPDELIEYRPL